MYEFKPKKTDKIAPIWFILVAIIALLVGANITLYFFPVKESGAKATATATQTVKITTPSTTPTQSITPTTTPTIKPTTTSTSTI